MDPRPGTPPPATQADLDADAGETIAGATTAEDSAAVRPVLDRKILGPYEILEELGRGAVGVVYKARHGQLKRTVALKVLIAGEDASPEAIERLHREAEAVAKLGKHPNIVPVHDVGVEGRLHYFAMHFVEGTSLDRVIDDEEIGPKRAAVITAKLADALHHAHGHGILHRDVKPSNILLDEKGEPLLSDFGLAKDVESESRMTRSGVTLGTPAYMPPEQAEGRLDAVDARSDVYSLGATLYEMLTWSPPFEGPLVFQVIQRVIQQDPAPPRKRNPRIDRDLETICLKCLEKAPARRYASASALREDLDRYLAGRPILARPLGRPERAWRAVKRNRAVSAVLAAAAVLLLLLCAATLGPGTLSVASDPPGARVRIDGRPTGRVTPLRSFVVWPPGRRTVELFLDGHDPARRELRVGALVRESLSVPLAKDHGFLRLAVEPRDAAVLFVVDGTPRPGDELLPAPDEVAALQAAFPAPVPGCRVFKLPKGTHRIELAREGYETASDAVYVTADRVPLLQKTLRCRTGRVSVTCDVEGVALRATRLPSAGETGPPRERACTVPAEDLPLEVGTWSLVFEKENHFPRREEVTVEAQASRSLNVTLQPMLLWDTETDAPIPSSTAVFANGRGEVRVAVHASDGTVHLLDGRGGKVMWRAKAGASSTSSPAAADLDGDGLVEIVACGTDALFVLGEADGGLKARIPLEGEARETRPVLADFDGDGHLDVAVVQQHCGVVAHSVVRGKPLWSFGLPGSPAWRSRVFFRNLPALHDVDGDGVQDIVLACTALVRVLSGATGQALLDLRFRGALGSGSPVVAPLFPGGPARLVKGFGSDFACLEPDTGRRLWTFPAGARIESTAAVADLNGDRVGDVVFGAEDEAVTALDGSKGAPLWKAPVGTRCVSPLSTYDVDGDAVPDVLFGAEDFHVRALSGRTGGALWSFRAGNEVKSAVEIADVDGDGSAEALFTSMDKKVYAVRCRPDDRVLWTRRMGSLADDVHLRDANGDGTLDVLVTSRRGAVLALDGRRGDALWTAQGGETTERFCASQTPLGDLDGDGSDELAVVGDRRRVLHVFSGRTGALLWTFAEASGSGVLTPPWPLGDVDGDGAPDVLATSISATVLSGRDGSTLWRVERAARAARPLDDVDGDGAADVGFVSGTFSVVSGADGTPLWDAPSRPQDFRVVADLDGDGARDLVLVHAGGAVEVLSSRDGRRLSGGRFPPFVLAVELLDADRDGGTDLLATSLIQAQGRTATRVTCVSGRTAQEAWSRDLPSGTPFGLAGDGNGDGIPDLAVNHEGGVTVLSGADGSTLREIPGAFLVKTLPVDGDGAADLVCYSDPEASLVAVGGRSGEVLFRYGAPSPLVKDLEFTALDASDLDGDGREDLVALLGDTVHAVSLRPRRALGVLWTLAEGRQAAR